MKTYQFNKGVNTSKLREEITMSNIITALAGITSSSNLTKITFKATLSSSDFLTLGYLIDMHNPQQVGEGESISTIINEVPTYAESEIDKTYLEQSIIIETSAEQPTAEGSISFPYPIILLGGECPVREDMVGDDLSVRVEFAAPTGNIIGQLTEGFEAGATEIIVNSKAAEKYIFKSFRVGIIDPITGEYNCLGECIGKEGDKIFLREPATFSKEVGAMVGCVAIMIPYLYFSMSPQTILIGNSTNRGSYVPANAIIRILYNNNTRKTKTVGVVLEYYV